ncbi:MAG: hypothetical protein KF764_08735 [Labilithrix sp.]|nr:hypothetical protein [Labilithrix sp.]
MSKTYVIKRDRGGQYFTGNDARWSTSLRDAARSPLPPDGDNEGVFEHAASRGIVLPLDFVAWLIHAPRSLDFEQCAALHLASRSWSGGDRG